MHLVAILSTEEFCKGECLKISRSPIEEDELKVGQD
jgi:hypothetical protein